MDLPKIIEQNFDKLIELCHQSGVKRIYAFGSVITDRFDPENEWTEGFSKEVTDFFKYQKDLKTKSAVEKQLGIIGEAINQFREEEEKMTLSHIMKNYIITLLLSVIMIGSASAQQLTGLIDRKDLGVQFTIPNGWFGQEAEAALVLGSNTEVGLILMMQHEYSTIAEIKAEADAGLMEEGIMLQRSGNYETIGTNGIGAEFSGSIQGAQAKAYIASLVNPHGAGITIMSMTESDKFSARYRELAHLIAKSVKFSKPVVPPIVNEWKEALLDTRLSYLSSYSSGSSGGSNSSVYIHLCRAGYFKYSRSSSLSIDTGGAFGYSGGSGQGNGRWDVLSDGQGGAMLVLYFEDGSTNEYGLSFQDGKTFLNGNRYFKTGKNDPNYPADCP